MKPTEITPRVSTNNLIRLQALRKEKAVVSIEVSNEVKECTKRR
jgi:hypothetical protein